MNKSKLLKFILISIILLLLIVLIFNTYSKYTGTAEGSVEKEIADWNIKVNDKLITEYGIPEVNADGSVGVRFDIDEEDFVWTGEGVQSHVAEGKVAPGMIGIFTLTIDPQYTQTALEYDIKIDDGAINSTTENLNMSVKEVTVNGSNLTIIRDENDSDKITIHQMKTLAQVESTNTSERVDVVQVTVEWLNNEVNNESDTKAGSIKGNIINIPVQIVFKQYVGE